MSWFGMDADPATPAHCSARHWPDTDVRAGLLLFGFGTAPHPRAVLHDGFERAVGMVQPLLEDQMERVGNSTGALDLQYAATCLMDAMNTANRQVCELSAFLGQGIYLGGGIIYITREQYLLMTFGGAAAYSWNGDTLMRQAQIPSLDGLIRDALGVPGWKGKFWKSNLPEKGRLFLMTEPVNLPEETLKQLRETERSNAHYNTRAMILRRRLNQSPGNPTAVLDMKLK